LSEARWPRKEHAGSQAHLSSNSWSTSSRKPFINKTKQSSTSWEKLGKER